MVTAHAFGSSVTHFPALQTSTTRPPNPPRGLATVLLDEYDVGSELVVAIDTDDVVTVQLHAKGLDASGTAHAATWRFQNQSVFALGDIDVVGYDTIAERCVNGKISIGLTWNPTTSGVSAQVAGSALAEGTWTGGLFRFTTVAGHSFNTRVVRLISTEPFPSGSTRFASHRNRRDGGKIFRLGSDS